MVGRFQQLQPDGASDTVTILESYWPPWISGHHWLDQKGFQQDSNLFALWLFPGGTFRLRQNDVTKTFHQVLVALALVEKWRPLTWGVKASGRVRATLWFDELWEIHPVCLLSNSRFHQCNTCWWRSSDRLDAPSTGLIRVTDSIKMVSGKLRVTPHFDTFRRRPNVFLLSSGFENPDSEVANFYWLVAMCLGWSDGFANQRAALWSRLGSFVQRVLASPPRRTRIRSTGSKHKDSTVSTENVLTKVQRACLIENRELGSGKWAWPLSD